MGLALKKQWEKIKENWIFIVAIIVLLLFLNSGSFGGLMYSAQGAYSKFASSDSNYYGSAPEYASSSRGGYSDNFAPEVSDRKITKTASLSTEVERGEFQDASQMLNNIVLSSSSFLLNKNENRYGDGWRSYYSGYYTIKVETEKYDSVVSQLREIGEVQSFNENTNDITGQYTNTELNIQVERTRLQRYLALYEEAKEVDDKLEINDRIFDQERTIKYLEDSLRNLDRRVDYSTISFTIEEEQSGYANIDFVDFSSLISSFVRSLNSLLTFFFKIVSWAVVLIVLYVGWKLLKKTKAYKKINN